tara:strand:+ start:11940 stop:13100 length:1161 start_codon:yes stop_codon:yes gene_type:complete
MSYAEGILLAIQGYEAKLEAEKEREFEKSERIARQKFDREKFDAQLAARNRNAVLPLVLEQLKYVRGLEKEETENKRRARKYFSQETVNALSDSKQLKPVVDLVEKREEAGTLDRKFLKVLDEYILKQVEERDPERSDKITTGVNAALNSSEKINTIEEQRNALIEADLATAGYDVLVNLATMNVDKAATQEPFDFSYSGLEAPDRTDRKTIFNKYSADLKPYVGDAIKAVSDGYGGTTYIYEGEGSAEARSLVEKMVEQTIELNRLQEYSDQEDYTIEGLTSAMSLSLQDIMQKTKSPKSAINYLNQQFSNVSLTSPKFEFSSMPTLETASENVDVIEAPLSGSVSADEVSKAVAMAGLPGSEEKDEEDEELGGFGTVVESNIIK